MYCPQNLDHLSGKRILAAQKLGCSARIFAIHFLTKEVAITLNLSLSSIAVTESGFWAFEALANRLLLWVCSHQTLMCSRLGSRTFRWADYRSRSSYYRQIDLERASASPSECKRHVSSYFNHLELAKVKMIWRKNCYVEGHLARYKDTSLNLSIQRK